MQLTLEGKLLDDIAIDRLRAFEPPEGYWLAFSGGKASVCAKDLCLRAGVKFESHYNVTGIDAPEVVYFIRQFHPDVIFEMPEMSIWKWIEKKGLPTRQHRWCCEKLKERGGHGRRVVTGIQWSESFKRSKRQIVEACFKDKLKVYINPIIDWQDVDIWQYMKERNLPYCKLYDEGFTRLGCILCPMAGSRKEEGDRYPKIREAWHRAALRYFEKHLTDTKTDGIKRFADGEQFWQWWLSGKSVKNYIESQEVGFE